MFAKGFENLIATSDKIAVFKDLGVNHAFRCQVDEQGLERLVEFPYEDLGLVISNAEFLLYKSNGIFKVGADSQLYPIII